MKKIFLNVILVTAVSFFFIAPLAVSGQVRKAAEAPQNEDRQILQALLEEVRQLRLELRRANAVSQRLQVALARIRLQEARVESLTRSLQTARTRLVEVRETQSRVEDEIKEGEERISRETNADRQAMLEFQIKEMRNRLSISAREEEQARNREASLNAELQTEQAKLSDLNNQLDNIMRQLETP
jgi:chromosome segregation ATPase